MLIPMQVLRLIFPAAIQSHFQTAKALWLVLMCEHGLSQNTLFKACVLSDRNNPWMVLHETGQLGLNNNARKLMLTATWVFFEFNP